MSGHGIPFPGDDLNADMSIEIPKRSSGSAGSSDENRKEQQTTRSVHHHPRQPGPASDGYFSGSISALHGSQGGSAAPRTPGSTHRGGGGHSRNTSTATAMTPGPTKGSQPMAVTHSSGSYVPSHPSHLALATSASAPQDWPTTDQNPWGGMGGGLPSPSTLTDILLGLHSTLYGGKRSPEEVREMVWRYYDVDAVFESPLLSAVGREQVANQFIMAFALPGLDVTSELRDIICSDFEFDGTRAGIIDQTLSVTIFPSIFGSSSSHLAASTPVQGGTTDGHRSSTDRPHGAQTPGQSLHHPNSVITPHPFADYRTPGASTFGPAHQHQPHSPRTPFSMSSLWGGGASRPHTPGEAGSSHVRPFTTSAHPAQSINGDEDDRPMLGSNTVFASAEEGGGGNVSLFKMPQGANAPHWASPGLGRSTFGSLLWGLFHPRAVLKNLCTINLRLMSRLEFNDEGHIVRHEDSWGLRETIEGTVPFASLVYALERRIVGYIASWAVAKGFALSSALHPHAIEGSHAPVSDFEVALMNKKDQHKADEAAHALLGRSRRQSHQFNSGFQHDYPQTISRSRAPSPTRLGWSHSHSTSAAPFITGTRSRARSSTGSLHGGSRTTSSDNLLSLNQGGTPGTYFASGYERGADKDLPPDSSARYKGFRRLDGGRTGSTASAPPSELAGSLMDAEVHGRQSKAPDRDLI